MKSNLSFCYRLVCWFFHFIFEKAYKGKLYGLENIPSTGGFILAGNHVSYLDPPFIAIHASRQPVYSFARQTLFKRGIGWFFRRLYMIPVDRDKGSDIHSIKRILKLLADGNSVQMFPEGTRSPTGLPQRAKKGIGLFVSKAKVPVVPVRIFGTYEAWPKGAKWPNFKPNVVIVYGKPISYEELAADAQNQKDPMQAISDRIMQEIARLQCPQS